MATERVVTDLRTFETRRSFYCDGSSISVCRAPILAEEAAALLLSVAWHVLRSSFVRSAADLVIDSTKATFITDFANRFQPLGKPLVRVAKDADRVPEKTRHLEDAAT